MTSGNNVEQWPKVVMMLDQDLGKRYLLPQVGAEGRIEVASGEESKALAAVFRRGGRQTEGRKFLGE